MDVEPTKWLESIIDEYADEPKPLESFILPGGTRLASELHVCRTVTRRAERSIVAFNHYLEVSKENDAYETQRKESEANPYVQMFINRLSDYFFLRLLAWLIIAQKWKMFYMTVAEKSSI